MPVTTVPFFDRHAVDASCSASSPDTTVGVVHNECRRNHGRGNKPNLEFARMVDGKEVGNNAKKPAAA